MVEEKSTTTAAAKQTLIHVTALDGIVTMTRDGSRRHSDDELSLHRRHVHRAVHDRAGERHDGGDRRVHGQAGDGEGADRLRSPLLQLLPLLVAPSSESQASDQPLQQHERSQPGQDERPPPQIRLSAAAAGSVVGCVFLMLSIVDFIRVKLGFLSCGGKPVTAVVMLVVLVGCGLLVYAITAVIALVVVEEEEEEEVAPEV